MRVTTVLALVLCVGAFGCSDDESPLGSGGGAGAQATSTTGSGASFDTLEAFCDGLAADFCGRCAAEEAESCVSELASDCKRNGEERDPGGYTADEGQACADKVAEVDCESPPLNCKGNLAIAECNNYLDGQTNGVDPDCP